MAREAIARAPSAAMLARMERLAERIEDSSRASDFGGEGALAMRFARHIEEPMVAKERHPERRLRISAAGAARSACRGRSRTATSKTIGVEVNVEADLVLCSRRSDTGHVWLSALRRLSVALVIAQVFSPRRMQTTSSPNTHTVSRNLVT